MKSCPFEYQRRGSPRQISPEDRERLYLNEGFVFAIFGMEMCRTVVVEVHSNHNPKESSYLRHFFFRFYPLSHPIRPKPHRTAALRDQGTSNPLAFRPDCRGRRFTGAMCQCPECGWACGPTSVVSVCDAVVGHALA